MASFIAPAYAQALTAQGGTNGVVAVTETSGFKPGAYAYIRGPGGTDDARRVRIMEVQSSTAVRIRFDDLIDEQGFKTGASYPSKMSSNDMSGFAIASTLSMPEQPVAGKRNDLDPLDHA